MQLTNMVTRRSSPKYSLDKAKSVPVGKVKFSRAAARDIENMGYTVQDVKDCIDGLQEFNFTMKVVFDYGEKKPREKGTETRKTSGICLYC